MKYEYVNSYRAGVAGEFNPRQAAERFQRPKPPAWVTERQRRIAANRATVQRLRSDPNHWWWKGPGWRPPPGTYTQMFRR